MSNLNRKKEREKDIFLFVLHIRQNVMHILLRQSRAGV